MAKPIERVDFSIKGDSPDYKFKFKGKFKDTLKKSNGNIYVVFEIESPDHENFFDFDVKK